MFKTIEQAYFEGRLAQYYPQLKSGKFKSRGLLAKRPRLWYIHIIIDCYIIWRGLCLLFGTGNFQSLS